MSSVTNVSVASVVTNTPLTYDMSGIVTTTHTKMIEDREEGYCFSLSGKYGRPACDSTFPLSRPLPSKTHSRANDTTLTTD